MRRSVDVPETGCGALRMWRKFDPNHLCPKRQC